MPDMRMPYSERLVEALTYAARLHREQVRKGSGVPYLTHLLAVAALVGEAGGDEDQMIAALLHDAVEDQGGQPRLADIRERFGEDVARIVEGCTDSLAVPRPPWRERKEQYLKHLRTADARTRLVSLADKLHNARSIVADLRTQGPRALEKFTGKCDGALWYFRSLVETFGACGAHPLLDELDCTVQEMGRLAGASDVAETR
jgi:(p)ppGpp synthase/HD superfamily hydrolase